MNKRKIILGLTTAIIAMVISLSAVYAQQEDTSRGREAQDTRRQAPEGRGQRPDPRAGQRGGGERGAQQMQQMMLQGVRRQLDVSDEEWEVLEPRISKVMQLSNESRFAGFRGMMGGRGRGDESREDSDRTPMQKAVDELQDTIRNSEASPEQVRQKLTAVRKEREKLQQELAKARAELLSVLSLRQEAALVLMGMLD